MSAPTEPVWKRWLDRLLMVNVLLVFIGAGVFAVAVVQQGQGHDQQADGWGEQGLPQHLNLVHQPVMALALSHHGNGKDPCADKHQQHIHHQQPVEPALPGRF